MTNNNLGFKAKLYKKRNIVRFAIGEAFVGLSFVGTYLNNDILWCFCLVIAAFLFGMNYEQVYFAEKQSPSVTSITSTGDNKEVK